MGEIINSKILPDNNIICKIALEMEEALALKNTLNNIHLFSQELFEKEAKIIERGKNGVTKYFHIPFSLRFRKKKSYTTLSYQKLENHSKIFYIYVIHKGNSLKL